MTPNTCYLVVLTFLSDLEFFGTGIRTPCIQGTYWSSLRLSHYNIFAAYSIVFHGRDRCCTRLPECVNCCQLYQGQDKERSIHHHLTKVRSIGLPPGLLPYSSRRNDMFELSHRLIGIYKTANATQSRFSWARTFDVLTDVLKVSRLTTMHWLSPNHRLRLHKSLPFLF